MSGSFAFLTPTLPERRSLLEECKESVAAQTHSHEHLVGVDEKREGPAVVRNRLAQQTEAEWLVPLDDDDLVDPNFLETLVPHLDNADIVYTWCRVEDYVNGLPPWTPNRLFRPESLLRFNFIPVTAAIRRSLWEKVEGMPSGDVEDWRMWLKCLAEGARFQLVPEVRWTYRRGISAESRNEWLQQAA